MDQSASHDHAEYDYHDYNWGDDEAENEVTIGFEHVNQEHIHNTSDNASITVDTVSVNPKAETDKSVKKPAQNSKITKESDPLMSLHAALGITTDAGSRKTYNKVVEAELEESQNIEGMDPFERASAADVEEVSNDDVDEFLLEPLVEVDEPSLKTDTAIEDKSFSVLESLEKAEATFEKNYQQAQAEKSKDQKSYDTPSESIESGFLVNNIPLDDSDASEWTLLVKALGLSGSLLQIAQSSTMSRLDSDKLSLVVSPSQDMICTDSAKAGIEKALLQHFDKSVSFIWSFAEPESETPAQYWRRKAQEKHQEACKIVAKTPFAQQLFEKFGAELDFGSVEYIENA